ncbi:uncharacterized protein LOC108307898 [Cebus imitator]|uniref:uncharacterized protein LOC108307898 n=1 Tax=Cebus imitator TaxID=2715852 RepID=UPI00080A2599|nr:uncharacterized protein LOC108307898 [Cebus imitator]
MSFTCPTRLPRVPVTRPPRVWALEGRDWETGAATWGRNRTPQPLPHLTSASKSRPGQQGPERDTSSRKDLIVASSTVTLRHSPESQAAGALGDTQTEPSLDQVLQERDEAIAKKRAVEAELHTCKARLHAVEAQLLEVLEEKLRLRRELEAWEEDMQRLVWQQVQNQLQKEAEGTRGAHVDPGAARTPWSRFSLGRGRWW